MKTPFDETEEESERPIDLYLTPAHACSYLDRNDAQTLFADPRRIITDRHYQRLADQGYRRSGSHLYRPHCSACSACIPLRLPVASFRPSRSQRRNRASNADLHLQLEPARFTPRHYHLYERYISLRHADGDMYPASEDQFRSFLLSPWSKSEFLCLYEGDRLLSVAVTDQQLNGLSAVYTFFEPSAAQRGLGVLSILQQIDLCQERDLPFLYLGYWIKGSPKMAYKTDFRPTQMLIENRWITLN